MLRAVLFLAMGPPLMETNASSQLQEKIIFSETSAGKFCWINREHSL